MRPDVTQSFAFALSDMAIIRAALRMFGDGDDTVTIAEALRLPEPVICQVIAHDRDITHAASQQPRSLTS